MTVWNLDLTIWIARRFFQWCLQLAVNSHQLLAAADSIREISEPFMSSHSANPDSQPEPTVADSSEPVQSSLGSIESADARVMLITNCFLLVLCTAVIALSFIMNREGESVVYFPFTTTPMPEACHLKREYGVDCPGCGLTRAFISIVNFDFRSALQLNPASFLFFVVVVVQIPWRITQLIRFGTGKRQLDGDWFIWFVIFCAAVMLLQWVLKLCGISF